MSREKKNTFLLHGGILALAGIIVRVIGMLYRIPLINIIGSEGNGIAKQTLKNCDKVFTIQMAGKVNSLNVSVSTGIAVYEAFKQRF